MPIRIKHHKCACNPHLYSAKQMKEFGKPHEFRGCYSTGRSSIARWHKMIMHEIKESRKPCLWILEMDLFDSMWHHIYVLYRAKRKIFFPYMWHAVSSSLVVKDCLENKCSYILCTNEHFHNRFSAAKTNAKNNKRNISLDPLSQFVYSQHHDV